jgi:hypothetical protein
VVRTEEEYQSEQRIIESIRFTPEQIAAIQEVPIEHRLLNKSADLSRCLFLIRISHIYFQTMRQHWQGWRVLRGECRCIGMDRQKLVADLRRHLTSSGDSGGLPLADCVQQLRINTQDEVILLSHPTLSIAACTVPVQLQDFSDAACCGQHAS